MTADLWLDCHPLESFSTATAPSTMEAKVSVRLSAKYPCSTIMPVAFLRPFKVLSG